MQDRYVGDIGDFGKYGMLRWLSGITGDSMGDALKLGIVWYLNEPTNKESKSDGSKTEYLKCTDNNHQRFRVCDKDLYLVLKDLVDSDNRRVTAVKEKGILGSAEFYSRLLPAPTDKQIQRERSRKARGKER